MREKEREGERRREKERERERKREKEREKESQMQVYFCGTLEPNASAFGVRSSTCDKSEGKQG